MCNFRVGQKVVCIGEFKKLMPFETLPTLGQVLTIRDISPGKEIENFGKFYLRFEEIHNEPYDFNDVMSEVCFISTKFRPVISNGMKTINAILRKVPEDVH